MSKKLENERYQISQKINEQFILANSKHLNQYQEPNSNEFMNDFESHFDDSEYTKHIIHKSIANHQQEHQNQDEVNHLLDHHEDSNEELSDIASIPSITLTNEHEYFQWVKAQSTTSNSTKQLSNDSYINKTQCSESDILDKTGDLSFKQFKRDLNYAERLRNEYAQRDFGNLNGNCFNYLQNFKIQYKS